MSILWIPIGQWTGVRSKSRSKRFIHVSRGARDKESRMMLLVDFIIYTLLTFYD